ncbi:hypothetical protein [Leptolyngbya sp. PCC 6406]|uniref:hypothetical protein n=1 Tax=Leptolyngbya sp. PCC 6406 TaxID=1173264 RepID=UPI001CEC529A|nr:hypothetical protein [Leptolyngbya sp. PCC 6406]
MGQINPPYSRLSRRYGRWFALALMAALVDGKLLLAVAVGLGVYRYAIAPSFSSRSLGISLGQHLRRMCQGFGQRSGALPWVVGTGAFGATYLTAALWAEVGGWPTLAFVSLGGLNVLTLLLLWQNRNGQGPAPRDHRGALSPSEGFGFAPQRQPPLQRHSATQAVVAAPGQRDLSHLDLSHLEQRWQHLYDADPLKRLIAVRWLAQWGLQDAQGEAAYLPGTEISVRSHLADCYHLMLTQEPEPAVRAALRDALGLLKPKPQLSPGQPPMPPLRAPVVPATCHRPVEYLEP